MSKKINNLKKIALIYGISLLIIASLRYIPGATDPQGLLFGLFHLDWLDDIVHTITGLGGIYAARTSIKNCILYFKGIGFLYSIDAVIGLLYGQNPLHIGFWTGEPLITNIIVKILVNTPHFLGGFFALFLAFHIVKNSK